MISTLLDLSALMMKEKYHSFIGVAGCDSESCESLKQCEQGRAAASEQSLVRDRQSG